MAELDTTALATVDTPKDFGRGAEAEYRRWSVELALAKKRMKDWRTQAKKVWDIYHGKSVQRKKNSFNALWANTEILAPSIYNTLPTPDVRRRFAQQDPLGKTVSEVMNRSLTFNAETTDFDAEIQMDILDMLIVGRGLSRVRYVPDLVQVGDVQQTGIEAQETNLEHEAQEGEQNEELAWETAPVEHVKWDKYLCGPGRSFKEIPWWAFEHDLTRDELVDRFGDEIGNTIPLNGGPADTDVERERINDDQSLALFKTAKVWEIWDKDSRTVKWLAEGYPNGLAKVEADPLKLQQFFPFPNPLRAIADSDTFEPTTLYEQYKEQAEELDRVSTRINKIMSGLKLRAIYDPSLGTQVAELFRGEDNDLIPADSSIKQLYEAGGIASAIWWAPIEQAAKVLDVLRQQREQCKQVIYELTGLADIMRGASDPSETKGAQDLKVAFGMTRLSRMQRDVQRYIRDLFALQAEIMCERFQIDTLKQMTQVQLPTDAEVMSQMMQVVVTAKMQGANVPPLPPKPITWEDVKKAMSDDAQRTFRVDIETDSTIAAAQQEDASDLQAVLSAIVELVKEVGPMVQIGVLPFPAFKELLLMTARKFRMGSSVEDAIDQMQPPKQGQPPVQLQVEQMRQEGKKQEIAAQVQADQQRAQADAQVEYAKQHAQALQAQQENALEAQRNQLQAQNEAMLERMRVESDAALERMKAEMQAQTQLMLQAMKNQSALEVAEITTGAQLQAAQISAASAGSGEE
ncbi:MULTISPECIES: hypothetical protein [Burkholderia]|uniref:Portal protein n=1 Tax=Burkholderia pyrrocinia TaxID=60550 RepID=A0A318JLH0_BURPY|nr:MULTISPECIES: hypothetical protein [Burkholderia]PXX41092.1 hypothetical protein NA66_1001702 [Burkholderia pyrrocinia]SFW58179.1 hypothetical protein SAMN03159384_03019 [Burkholderia sp. NFACC33-1]SFY11355.1 hypothetical protein SAMN03159408_03231 [Burkholderia sp. NFPP32]